MESGRNYTLVLEASASSALGLTDSDNIGEIKLPLNYDPMQSVIPYTYGGSAVKSDSPVRVQKQLIVQMLHIFIHLDVPSCDLSRRVVR